MLRFICALFCCIGLSIYAAPANADYFTDIVAAGASARQGHYVEAIRRLSAALSVASLDPGVRSSLLSVRASMRYQNAEPALALFDFNDAIALTPDKGSLYWSRGIAYQSMGFLDRAIADFDTALRLEPYQTGVYASRASIYLARYDFDSAFQDINRAITAKPNDSEYVTALATAYLRQGNFGQASDAAERAFALQPKSVLAFEVRGDIRLAEGRYDEAVADYSHVLDVTRVFYWLYMSRGAAHLRMGDFTAADDDYRHAERYQSQSPIAAFALGRLQLYTADYARADASFAYSFEHNRAAARPYVLLWRFLLAIRQGAKPGAVPLPHAADATTITSDAWPRPIVEMFLGHVTPDQVLTAAQNGKPLIQRDQTCEAEYYVGEYKLAVGQREQGIALLRQARTACPREFIESEAATMHLAELNA